MGRRVGVWRRGGRDRLGLEREREEERERTKGITQQTSPTTLFWDRLICLVAEFVFVNE